MAPLMALVPLSRRLHHIPTDRPCWLLLLRCVQPGLPCGQADRPGLPQQRTASHHSYLPAWVLPFSPRARHSGGMPKCRPAKNGNLPLPALLEGSVANAATPASFQLGHGFMWATPGPVQAAHWEVAQRGYLLSSSWECGPEVDSAGCGWQGARVGGQCCGHGWTAMGGCVGSGQRP